ncbi:MAG: response regulator [Gemmatimonadaceae bacterium]
MPKVLIIDDEPSIRFALRRWFERQGWSADEATDGAKALEFLHLAPPPIEDKYAVIVCDLRMPGMSGAQFHAVLTNQYPTLIEKLVVTTGDDVASPPIGSVLGTHRRILQKPFEFDVLRGLVESIVGQM